MALACDTHPVQNLKVLARLRQLGLPEEQVTEWAAWANREGLAACETLIADEAGPFCFGAAPTIADLCLVPQLANARRFGVDVAAFPRLLEGRSRRESNEGVRRRRTGPAARCRVSPPPITMDAVYTAPGYLFRRMQQIAVAIFVEECKALRSDAGAICRAGRDPHPSRHRRDAAVGGDRVRPLDARQRDRAAGGQDAISSASRSREDKRVKLLYLTKSGAALLRDIMPSVDRAQARMLQPLKPADRKTLLALLTQLVDLNNEASRVPLRAEDALEHLGKSG